jgi:hypothetical protein
MNIREAILKAADHIEANPREFGFWFVYRPDGPGCGTPGCALGWVGYFSGAKAKNTGQIAEEVLGYDSLIFYSRMTKMTCGGTKDWHEDAAECARRMRIYADTYHPAEPEISLTVQSELDRIFAATRERAAARH